MGCDGKGKCEKKSYEAWFAKGEITGASGDCSTIPDARKKAAVDKAVAEVEEDEKKKSSEVNCGRGCNCLNLSEGKWEPGHRHVNKVKQVPAGGTCILTIAVTYDQFYRFQIGDCVLDGEE